MYRHPGNRPRFLNLAQIHFPLNAKLSGLHRITGAVLVVCLLVFLGLANVFILYPNLHFATVSQHWSVTLLSSVFWLSLSFHWLSGLRHLLAEHFTNLKIYQTINSHTVSYLFIFTWIFMSFLILHQAWS